MTDVDRIASKDDHENNATTPSTSLPPHTNGVKTEEVDESTLLNGTNGTNGHVTGYGRRGSRGSRKRNADDAVAPQGSIKKRKLQPMGLGRAVSPPWQFGSVDKATLSVDGKRRSARTTATSSPQLQSDVEEKRLRRQSTTTHRPNFAALHNGRIEGTKPGRPALGSKRQRSPEKDEVPQTFKRPTRPAKRSEQPEKKLERVFRKTERFAKVQEQSSPPKTPRARRKSSTVASSSDNLVPTSSPVRKNARRSARNVEVDRSPASDPYASLRKDTSSGPTKLKISFRRPKLGRSHPSHFPAPKKYASFEEWLQHDNALEGETDVPLTEAEQKAEVEIRLRLARATEPGGLLTEGRCARFLEDNEREAPPRYGVWQYLCAHAVNFHGLLKKEQDRHRRSAKHIAAACQVALATEARWARIREQKTKEELDEEEKSYQIKRYRQLVRDVGGAWSLARGEVLKIRAAEAEKEQETLGVKALDNMLESSKKILFQQDNTQASDEEHGSVGPTGSETGTGAPNTDSEDEGVSDSQSESSIDSENMSEDGSEEEDDMASEEEEDDRLGTDGVRAKHASTSETPLKVDSLAEDGADDIAVRSQSFSQVDGDVDGSNGDAHEGMRGDANGQMHEDALEGMHEDSHRESDGDSETDSDDGSGDRSDEDSNDEANDSDDVDQNTSLISLMLPRTTRTQTTEVQSAGDSSDMPDVQAVELEDVDPELLDEDDESIPSDDDESGDDGRSEAARSEASNASDSSDDDDHLGLLGFYGKAPKKQTQKPADRPSDASPLANETAEKEDIAIKSEETKEDTEETTIVSRATSQVGQSDRSHLTTPITPRTPMEQTKTEVPELLLRGKLREYQHDGMDWLAKLYNNGRNGILADEMGLGKTIQTIALLAHLAVHHQIWGPHLVIVPTSVMLNWEMEFKKWLPGFKILTYYGDIEERKKKRQGWSDNDKYNVCIASYQLMLKDAQAFKRRDWHYLILDEAHYIKNFETLKWQTMLNFKTHSRLLLTGTPLQNNLQELWSLLYFLMPGSRNGVVGFAELENFQNAMKRPSDQILNQGQQKLDAEAQARVDKLHEVLRPFLLRRLKSEVEKQMPGKYEHVVYCRLSKRQRQLYDEFMSRSDTKRTLSSGNYMSIMNCLMSLRKVCNHPDLFETRQIVTSYAMPKSVAADYEINELFVRRRLWAERDCINLQYSGLVPTSFEKHSRLHQFRRFHLRAIEPLQSLARKQAARIKSSSESGSAMSNPGFATLDDSLSQLKADAENGVLEHMMNCIQHSKRTTEQWPIYGTDLVSLLTLPNRFFPPKPSIRERKKWLHGNRFAIDNQCTPLQKLMPSLYEVAKRCEPIVKKFVCVTPAVVAEDIRYHALTRRGVEIVREAQAVLPPIDPYHEARIRTSIAFPDKRLLQYDCGKLQALHKLLRDLQSGGHRCLIFTQMTKVLDILEQFLNIHGHRYLRLDGSTKIEQRQILTDRFNNDPRILAFILSSRSGGLGINLTGADTVIFYDLDWNPAMDAQCQDRCHRIGQTRDVHIYRFVSEHTIEANILRKSNQKRLLDDVIIQKGEFTAEHFNRVTYRDAFADAEELAGEDADASAAMDRVLGEVTGLGQVLDSVEDREDAAAAKEAQKEAIFNADVNDFNDRADRATSGLPSREGTQAATGREGEGEGENEDEVTKTARQMEKAEREREKAEKDEMGRVDDYMVKFLLRTTDKRDVELPVSKAVLAARRNAKKTPLHRRR